MIKTSKLWSDSKSFAEPTKHGPMLFLNLSAKGSQISIPSIDQWGLVLFSSAPILPYPQPTSRMLPFSQGEIAVDKGEMPVVNISVQEAREPFEEHGSLGCPEPFVPLFPFFF